MDVREQNERIRKRNHEAAYRTYENMRAAFQDISENVGINAVLKFLNEKEKIDISLSMSEQLIYISEKLNIKTRYIKLDSDWYKACAVPMLVKASDGQWYAVIPSTCGNCFYMDHDKKVKVTRKNAQYFTSDAVCFYKSMPNGKITMFGLLSFMIKCFSKKDIVTVLVTSALAILAGMFIPWANSFIFSRIIPTGEIQGIGAVASLMFSVVTTSALLGLLQSLILTNALLRCSVYVQGAVISRLLSLKPDFFKKMRSGELSSVITEFADITNIISAKSISSCIGIVLSFIYLVQIQTYAPDLFGWIILSTVTLALLMITEGVLNSLWTKKYTKSLSKMSGFCYELFSGIEQIKLNGAEARALRRWSEYYLDASKKEDKPIVLKYSQAFYKLIKVLTTALIFLFGAVLTASDYIAFSSAYGAFVAASAGAGLIIHTISSFRSSYFLIKPMLSEECEEYDCGKKKPDTFDGEITISDIKFRYSAEAPYVLNGLSAHIGSGESVGIIGTSGCGKSTLIRLILGFEEIESGSIYIDGFDIRELDLKYYRSKIGTILQTTGLISGDIYSNITLTKPNASIEEVNAALEMAELSDTVASLPMGMHTPVSQENCTLSGGERQRILIARAIIAKPSILILDEATSALDNVTQAKITESINKLDCTKLIVAHRLSTIQNCDKILVMDKGVIVQQGTFDELKNVDGPFSKLMKKQNVAQ